MTRFSTVLALFALGFMLASRQNARFFALWLGFMASANLCLLSYKFLFACRRNRYTKHKSRLFQAGCPNDESAQSG